MLVVKRCFWRTDRMKAMEIILCVKILPLSGCRIDPYFMDAPDKGVPCFFLFQPDFMILVLQFPVWYNIDKILTILSVIVSCRELEGVHIQIVQHRSDRQITAEFLKYKDIFPRISIKGVLIVRYPVNIGIPMHIKDMPWFSETSGTTNIHHL